MIAADVKEPQSVELYKGCRQGGQTIVGRVETPETLEAPDVVRELPEAVVAEGKPLESR